MSSSVVRIDNEHYLWREDAKPYLVYRVPAGTEFIRDARGYKFDTSKFTYNFDPQRGQYSDSDLSPNTIEIAIALQEDAAKSKGTAQEPTVYRAKWNLSSQQHHINAQTLIPVGKSAPFTKFESGQRIIVSIGHLSKNEITKKELFYPFWNGMIDVQK